MYQETFVFENDFAAVKIETDIGRMNEAAGEAKDEADEGGITF